MNMIIEDKAKVKVGKPLPFNIRMTDNRIVVPRGVVKHEEMKIANKEFLVNLVVLAMKNATPESYQMLLGRPWLRDAKFKHDWSRDRISLRKGKKKMYIEQNKKNPGVHAHVCQDLSYGSRSRG